MIDMPDHKTRFDGALGTWLEYCTSCKKITHWSFLPQFKYFRARLKKCEQCGLLRSENWNRPVKFSF